MLDKKVIRKNFSAASGRYNSHAAFQKLVAEEVADRIFHLKSNPEKVLDIGAGTGFLSSAISGRTRSVSITALDLAHGMSTAFRTHNKGSAVVTGDAEFLPFCNERFDTVVSSFSMQWIPDFKKALNEILRVLESNGNLLLAMPGSGSFPELKESHDRFFDKSLWTMFSRLPCADEIRESMTHLPFKSFSVSRVTKTEVYKNSLAFLNTLKSIGARNPFLTAGHSGEYLKTKKMLSWYDSRFCAGAEGGVLVSYEILWIEGVK